MIAKTKISLSPIAIRTMRLMLAGFASTLIIILLLVVLHAAFSLSYFLLPLPFLGSALLLFSLSSIISGFIYTHLSHPRLRRPLFFISAVTLAMILLHFSIISEPSTNSIMDEQYYVPAANAILSGTQCGPYLPNCNLEHPFLSKGLISAGMYAFGSVPFGFRLMSVILGSACLPLIFAIAWKMSKNKKIAYYSTLLLGLDTMFFVHSSAALTDIFIVFFALAAFVVYFYGLTLGRLDSLVISGALLGLSALSKETAIFLVAALVTFHILSSGQTFRMKIFSSAKIAFVAVIVFCAGLQIYDSLLTGGRVPSFINHIEFMLSYGSSLTCPPFNCPGAFREPNGATITPLNWLTYYVPTTYFGTGVRVCSGTSCYSYVSLAYYGATNMIETWTVFIWLPIALLVIYRSLKQKRSILTLDRYGFSGNSSIRKMFQESDLLAFAMIIFAWNYFPFIFLFLAGRVTYPFYLLPAVPSIALGASYLITREKVPKTVAIVFLIAVFVWFIIYFPDKSFLPASLRSLLGT